MLCNWPFISKQYALCSVICHCWMIICFVTAEWSFRQITHWNKDKFVDKKPTWINYCQSYVVCVNLTYQEAGIFSHANCHSAVFWLTDLKMIGEKIVWYCVLWKPISTRMLELTWTYLIHLQKTEALFHKLLFKHT